MSWLLLLPLAWLLFNLSASYAPLILAERISPGRLPAELLVRGEARWVRFYVGNNVASYAFSSWAPFFGTAVVFDRAFFRRATPELVRFVVAHELGHAACHHHRWRWFAVVSGVAILPAVRRALARQESVADAYATALTGFKPEHFAHHFQPPKETRHDERDRAAGKPPDSA